MADHVTRMVSNWFERAEAQASKQKAASHLIDSIHRMIREAEDETRRRCEQIALQAASSDEGRKVAQAIRSLKQLGSAVTANDDARE